MCEVKAGKIGDIDIDTRNIICPICGCKMETYQIEPPKDRNYDVVGRRRYGGGLFDNNIYEKVKIQESTYYDVIFKCQHCGSELKVQFTMLEVEEREVIVGQRKIEPIDWNLAFRKRDD